MHSLWPSDGVGTTTEKLSAPDPSLCRCGRGLCPGLFGSRSLQHGAGRTSLLLSLCNWRELNGKQTSAVLRRLHPLRLLLLLPHQQTIQSDLFSSQVGWQSWKTNGLRVSSLQGSFARHSSLQVVNCLLILAIMDGAAQLCFFSLFSFCANSFSLPLSALTGDGAVWTGSDSQGHVCWLKCFLSNSNQIVLFF